MAEPIVIRPRSGTRPGKRTSKNIKDIPEGEKRDARIVTAGLLNHIIAKGHHPNVWPELLIHALNVHTYGTRKALGLRAKKPEWRDDNGNDDSQS